MRLNTSQFTFWAESIHPRFKSASPRLLPLGLYNATFVPLPYFSFPNGSLAPSLRTMRLAYVYNLKRSENVDEAEFDEQGTVDAIHNALASAGDEVVNIEMTADGKWIEELRNAKPDLVFNTAEGYHGIARESYAPIVFEQLQLPYVGSGPYACFLTLDKSLTKQVVRARGVSVADGYYLHELDELRVVAEELLYPSFIKPNFEGSSKGITARSLCHSKQDLIDYGGELLNQFPEGVLVESYVPGKDVAVAYISGMGKAGVLESIEYVNVGEKKGPWIYDYELKNTRDQDVAIRCPADISESSRKALKDQTLRCVQALGIQDMGRADFRVKPNGEICFIEFNALPSLQPGAGVFEAAKLLDYNYDRTIAQIVESARRRLKVRRRPGRPGRKVKTRNPVVGLVFNLKRRKPGEEGYEQEAEFDSQKTVDAIGSAIEQAGYQLKKVESSRELAQNLIDEEVDVVFNIAEGTSKRGREAQVPAVCDLLGIEHTGSDATCLAISLDKSLACRVAASEGIRTPKSQLLTKRTKQVNHQLRFPIIVKPNQEGTSKGVYDTSVSDNQEELEKAVGRLWDEGTSSIICEEYILGREFTVGVLGDASLSILGPMEIVFKDKQHYPVYSFEAKQESNIEDNPYFSLHCPVELEPTLKRRVDRFARQSFRALGCRDVARIDFRLTKGGEMVFLEANPLPGLSPGFSDLSIMGERCGVPHSKLIEEILKPAVRRWRKTNR